MSRRSSIESGCGRLAPGQIVAGRYRAQALIGRGGTGFIYAAEDLHAGRAVALKALDPDLIHHRSAVARYHREAKTAGGIGHPNICGVFDSGYLDDGAPFLIMELLTGRTLSRRIHDEGALPLADVVLTVAQILSALAAAHAKRIIHRDIKPDNVFLTNRIQGVEAVKLLDFGIAKSLDSGAEMSLTRTGMVIGTPFYMAPEQARGEKLDHRVDLYSTGVILYEMLTGHRPFHATNYNALMIQVLTSEPRDPRSLRPTIPQPFVDVLRLAMAKSANRRYDSAEAFLADIWRLRELLAPGPDEIAGFANSPRGTASSELCSVDDPSASDPSIPVFQDPGSFVGRLRDVSGSLPRMSVDDELDDKRADSPATAGRDAHDGSSVDDDEQDATRRGPRPLVCLGANAAQGLAAIRIDTDDEETARQKRPENGPVVLPDDDDSRRNGPPVLVSFAEPLGRPDLPSGPYDECGDTATQPFVRSETVGRGPASASEPLPSDAAALSDDDTACEDCTEVMAHPEWPPNEDDPRRVRLRPPLRPAVDEEVTSVDPRPFLDMESGEASEARPRAPRPSSKK